MFNLRLGYPVWRELNTLRCHIEFKLFRHSTNMGDSLKELVFLGKLVLVLSEFKLITNLVTIAYACTQAGSDS